MAEKLNDDSQSLESTTVGIYRTATVVKGGRRFSFGAMVVVGDRNGVVGIGYGKAPDVPAAIEKAQKDANKNLMHATLQAGTLPHPVTGIFGASKVRMVPASPGTGVIAGGTVRAVLEMAGVQDVLTKAYGSTNEKNLCKAVIAGLACLRTREQVAAHRGVTIETTVVDEALESAKRFLSQQQEGGERKKATAPVNVVGQERKRGGGGRGGRRRGPSARKPEASGAIEPKAPVTGASPESAPAKPPESAEPAAE